MSSSTNRPLAATSTSGTGTAGGNGQSYFEQQREILLREIDVSFGHVLANINKLNRSLEGVIDVGNEFSSVEALWSQFENVMAKDPDAAEGQQEGKGEGEEGDSRDETEMEGEEQTKR